MDVPDGEAINRESEQYSWEHTPLSLLDQSSLNDTLNSSICPSPSVVRELFTPITPAYQL